MRLTKTQAKVTLKYIKQTERLIIDAILSNNYTGLTSKIVDTLGKIPEASKPLLKELADYEAKYSAKKIKKYTGKDGRLTQAETTKALKAASVKTATNKDPVRIVTAYEAFAKTKAGQFAQILKDSKATKATAEEVTASISNISSGLMRTQNLVLAGLAVTGVAHAMRSALARKNNMLVDWVLSLELNNCPFCEEMADGSPYRPEDVEDIGNGKAHGNCGCTLVPVDE